jgi:hypothetical protein
MPLIYYNLIEMHKNSATLNIYLSFTADNRNRLNQLDAIQGKFFLNAVLHKM